MSARRWKPGTPTQKFNREIRGNRIVKVLIETIFDLENRVRALESRLSTTEAEYTSALREKYKPKK